MVPPMRPRAGTTLMLSTVANTAFSSATLFAATVIVPALANEVLATNAAQIAIAVNTRIDMPAIMSCPTGENSKPSAFCRVGLDLPQGSAAHARMALLCAALAARGRAIDAIQRGQNFTRRLARNRIIDRLGIAPRRNQTILPKQSKMLRHRGIAQAEERREIANRALAVDQLADDQQPVAVAQCLQKIARRIGGGFHDFNVHFHTCVYTIIRIYSQACIAFSEAQPSGRKRRTRAPQ